MDDPQPFGRDHRQLVVGQVDDLVGEAGHRRGVAGDEVFARAHADHQRRAQPGGDNHLRPVAEDDRQAVGAVELRQGMLDGGDQRPVLGRRHVLDRRLPLQATGDQVGDHLGIGVGAELVALLHERPLDRLEILDDAVMDQGQHAVPSQMGVRVDVGGHAVGGPAGMADAGPARQRRLGQAGFELVDPPRRLADGQFAAVVDDGHAGAVIAPILQTPQAAQQVVDRLPGADITHDSAHRCSSLADASPATATQPRAVQPPRPAFAFPLPPSVSTI